MLFIAIIFYLVMCFVSNWNLLWPVTMLIDGGLGDKTIAIIWGVVLFAGL